MINLYTYFDEYKNPEQALNYFIELYNENEIMVFSQIVSVRDEFSKFVSNYKSLNPALESLAHLINGKPSIVGKFKERLLSLTQVEDLLMKPDYEEYLLRPLINEIASSNLDELIISIINSSLMAQSILIKKYSFASSSQFYLSELIEFLLFKNFPASVSLEEILFSVDDIDKYSSKNLPHKYTVFQWYRKLRAAKGKALGFEALKKMLARHGIDRTHYFQTDDHNSFDKTFRDHINNM